MSKFSRTTLFSLSIALILWSAALPVRATGGPLSCDTVVIHHLEHKNGRVPSPEEFEGRRVDEIPNVIAEFMLVRLKELDESLKLTHDASFAINYSSAREQAEVIAKGLTEHQASKLFAELRERNIIEDLESLPAGLRNKYFLVPLSAQGSVQRAPIQYLFAWELNLKFKSHLSTGFGETRTAFIEPLESYKPSANAAIRDDLIQKGRAQETGATCGLAGICQVLNSRGVDISEWSLIEHAAAVRQPIDIVAHKRPGLSIRELMRVADEFKAHHPHGVKFEFARHSGLDPLAVDEFRANVIKASHHESEVDIVVNLYSPTIGRPGTGHFLPVAGYDAQTDYVLMNETNKAVNGSYWVALTQLYKSMIPEGPGERGYILITSHSN